MIDKTITIYNIYSLRCRNFSPEETELDVLESEVKNHIHQFIYKIETLTL